MCGMRFVIASSHVNVCRCTINLSKLASVNVFE
jgi:hypothetical protein